MKEYFPFPKPRKGQLETTQKIIDAFQKYDYVILSAPTGTGKSPIALSIARCFYDRKYFNSYLLVKENILLDQYRKDYDTQEDLAFIMGASNYFCKENGAIYPEAPCQYNKVKYRCGDECSYHYARKQAPKKPITCSNYVWMLEDKCSGKTPLVKNRDLIIMDEFHNVENILVDYWTISYTPELAKETLKTFKKILNRLPIRASLIHLERCIEKFGSHYDAGFAIAEFSEAVFNLNIIIDRHLNNVAEKELTPYEENNLRDVLKLMRNLHDVNNMMYKFDALSDFCDNISSIISPDEIKLVPLNVDWAYQQAFKSIKTLFMSATPQHADTVSKTFGIPRNKICEIEVESNFPVENRLVYAKNIDKLSYKTSDLNKFIIAIDEIIDESNGRIVIHSGNYKINEYIVNNSLHSDRFHYHKKASERLRAIEKYKQDPNGILVSPSVIEGLSLDDDLCRSQIIVKVPYLSLGNVYIKKRANDGSKWYQEQAVLRLIQASGRGVRHKDDKCTTYILDTCFMNLLNYEEELFPNWFLESVRICA